MFTSEPIKGKTYIADGWEYRDVPGYLTQDAKELLLSIIGEDNYVVLAYSERVIEGDTCWHGQLLISPQGMENLKSNNRKHAN